LRAHRILLLVAGFSIALWAGLTGIRTALDRSGIEALETRHGVASYYCREVDKALFRKKKPGEYRVALLGNSMIMSYPKEYQLANVLQAHTWQSTRGRPPIHVFNLGMEGTGIFDYYFMADVIAEANPHLVIIQFDLASPSQRFRSAFSRPEIAGWIESGRIARSVALPLSWVGLTFDRLLLYAAIVRTGLFDHWAGLSAEQTRVEEARKQLETELAFRDTRGRSPEEIYRSRRAFWSLGRSRLAEVDRFTEASMRTHFGAAVLGLPADDPTLRMLEATIRTFRGKGIEVLVYINPLNMDHLEKTGVLDRAGLALTLSRVEASVDRSGGFLLDLHDIFPDRAFRDAPGHLAYEDGLNGPGHLAARLAPIVVEAARSRSARDRLR
jgi:hypothetical protein